ncbi:hypothetical protein EDB92DRAFT_1815337 [Lactarius akahatsu]|uniref:Uncharacterized protein n=1 Tax=Lactarius akahatsu TaxID=416441 RepID=A0AAD4Q9C3_9AGAM|nr:hypothetical protein EDB92DRAFT_1815337 [Lactarius akahatsu]
MSASEAPLNAEQLHEMSDSVAAMVACILQEQLAPILETIREHSRLLDWHSALLNHSTVMNRYNVGKLDDLRDLQTNVNYKLQFHIDPEERKRPTYRGPQPTSALQSTAIATSTGSSPQKDAFPLSQGSPADSSSRGCTDSPIGTSSATSAPDPPARQLTPTFGPPASNSPNPPKVTTGGCGAPTTKRGLRRERAHDETPDPMWNSSREIDLSEPVPAPVPPPPYVLPPAYANGATGSRSETKEGDTPAAAQPSKKAAGKKRKRDDDDSGEARLDPPDECGGPERKRKKDTTISTERIPIPESFLRLARLNIFGEPSFEERRCEVEQMRYMKNLFRGGAT